MNRPLIVGEAPGKHGDPSRPCEGRVGARLAACAGITYDEYLTLFDRVNLLDEQPQDAPKGMAFNVKLAGKVARKMEQAFQVGQIVLILGKRAGSAFGLKNVPYFETLALNHAKVTIVPHPSGVNRAWNDLEVELQMIKFMHDVVRPFLCECGCGKVGTLEAVHEEDYRSGERGCS